MQKSLIGASIWLNDVFDPENFLTNYPNSFIPFQNVLVKDVVSFSKFQCRSRNMVKSLS